MQRQGWKTRLGMLALAGSVASCVTASPLPGGYMQAPVTLPDTQLVNSNRLVGGEGSDQDVQTFDSFQLTTPAQITRICWRGGAADATLAGFTLTLYPATDNAFAGPDVKNPLEIVRVVGHANEIKAGMNLSDYSTGLERPLSLAANTKYWLSIVADKTDLSPWGWANSSDGDGKSLQAYTEFRTLPAAGDRSFCLTGDATQATHH